MGNNEDILKWTNWLKGQLILLFAVFCIFLSYKGPFQILTSVFVFFIGGLYGYHIKEVRKEK